MFTLPKLNYDYSALEPYIDAMTMEIHYTKHHQGYIDNLNAALQNYPELQSKTVQELLSNLQALPADIKGAVQNNGGGHLNHSMFWQMMTPRAVGEPRGSIADAIRRTFGDFSVMQEQFNTAAKTRFGSGWAWLSVDNNGKLAISSMANQDTPVSLGMTPILGLDVWEHAYYLKYQNKRVNYIKAWWHVVNWDYVEDHFAEIMK